MERQVHILGEPEINAYLFTAVPTLYVHISFFESAERNKIDDSFSFLHKISKYDLRSYIILRASLRQPSKDDLRS